MQDEFKALLEPLKNDLDMLRQGRGSLKVAEEAHDLGILLVDLANRLIDTGETQNLNKLTRAESLLDSADQYLAMFQSSTSTQTEWAM